jgi:hypothetical protein
MHQIPHSAEAPRQPGNSISGLVMSIGAWSIIFSSLLILLQLGLLYLFRANYTLTSRNGSLLLVFATLELTGSFFASLLVSSRTGRVGPGIFAGLLVRVLSGITDLYLTFVAWRAVLARIHSLVLEGQARQAIGRSFVELLVSLLLCVGITILGALIGVRLAGRSSTYLAYNPAGRGGTLPPAPRPRTHTDSGFPQTPTPNGWRFGPYDHSQTGRSSSDIEINEWVYSPPSNFPAYPAPQIGNYEPPVPEPEAGDTPTQPDIGNTPTELLQTREDTALPLPYPGRDSRYSPNWRSINSGSEAR